jgi:hypothetical protein
MNIWRKLSNHITNKALELNILVRTAEVGIQIVMVDKQIQQEKKKGSVNISNRAR